MEIKTISFSYKEYLQQEEISEEYRKLINLAVDAAKRAYAPYSHFHVGASLLLDNGEIITGNNQENAAYPSGLCAERVAIFYANAHYPNAKIKVLVIAAFYQSEQIVEEPVPPCGSCRQVIIESQFRQKEPITLLLVGKNKILVVDDASLLLPLNFNKDILL